MMKLFVEVQTPLREAAKAVEEMGVQAQQDQFESEGQELDPKRREADLQEQYWWRYIATAKHAEWEGAWNRTGALVYLFHVLIFSWYLPLGTRNQPVWDAARAQSRAEMDAEVKREHKLGTAAMLISEPSAN